MKSPNRRSSIDDELFEIALAIPALFAAARYLDTERERIALARLQGARAIAVAKAFASQKGANGSRLDRPG